MSRRDTTCDSCGVGFGPDDCGRIDDAGSWCDACHAREEREAQLAAGIPLAVIEGRAKLTDFFSPEYIAAQSNPLGGGA